MAFKLTSNPTFKHTVKVVTPVDGGHREEKFTATFNILSVDELEQFDLTEGAGTTAFLKRAVSHVEGIQGEDGEELPYNDEVRDLLFALPHVRIGLSRTYFDGVTKARKGN